MNLYKSKRWHNTRSRILRRDGYICQYSKRYGKVVPATVVHHIYPADQYPELAFEPWNLISLSASAHNKMHDRNTNVITETGRQLQDRVRLEYEKHVSPHL